MLRLLEFFGGKNSSPIFSKLVRARDSNPFILLVGTIKPYNLYYQHFLLRPFLGEIFAVPFHRAKMIEQGETVQPSVSAYARVCSRIVIVRIGEQLFNPPPLFLVHAAAIYDVRTAFQMFSNRVSKHITTKMENT